MDASAIADRTAAAVLAIVQGLAAEHLTGTPRMDHGPRCAGYGCPGCGSCLAWYSLRVEQP